MRLYIIRHADPDYENNTITPAGHLEAQALAKRMADEKLDRLYASTMGRAKDTMHYTEQALNKKGELEEWACEIQDYRVELQPWGRLAAWQVPGEVVRASANCGSDVWTTPCFQDPAFKQRCDCIAKQSDEFLSRHGYQREGSRYACVKPHQEKIAVFCHNGLGLTWLAHLLHLPPPLVWTGFWLAPSSVTTVLFDERSKHWAVPRCIGVGDTSHLAVAGLPVRPRGILTNFF
jgi:broad specificity phosphatase PhoE